MCDYPSECRWGRQFGVHTPLSPVFPPTLSSPNPHTTFEGILKPENVKGIHNTTTRGKGKKAEKSDFWGALLASATRRRSAPAASPLHLSRTLEDAEEGKMGLGVQMDMDGDVVMSSSPIPSQQTTASATSLSTDLAPTSTLTKTRIKSRSVPKLKTHRNQQTTSGLKIK